MTAVPGIPQVRYHQSGGTCPGGDSNVIVLPTYHSHSGLAVEDSALDRPTSEPRDDAARQAATCLPVVAPFAARNTTSRPTRLAEDASIAVLYLLLSLDLSLGLPLSISRFRSRSTIYLRLCYTKKNSAATLPWLGLLLVRTATIL